MLPLLLNHLRPSIQIALTDKPNAEQSWLGRSMAHWSLDKPVPVAGPTNLSATLDQLLSARPHHSKKSIGSPCHVSLVLPDDVARFEVLPWVESLMNADEIRQFAIERFEMMNQPVREGWVVQADWKTSNANTLAYALPHPLLDGFNEIIAKHGMVLNRVIPISALAHYGRLNLMRRNELRVMHSGANTSALLYLNGKLSAHLMEVVRGSTDDSIRRLLVRLQMSVLTQEIQLHQLAILGLDTVALKDIISINKPAKIHILNPLRWGGWQ